MGDVDRKILSALTRMRYVQRAHFSRCRTVTVLITRVEQIDKKWSRQTSSRLLRFSESPAQPHSVTSFLDGTLYFASRLLPHHRLRRHQRGLPLTSVRPSTKPMLTDAFSFKAPRCCQGPIAAKPLPPKTVVTALIYEYQKTSVDRGSPAVPIHSTVSAQTHLERAGLWQLLGNP